MSDSACSRLRWRWASFAELSSGDLYACLALRAQVFVVEQDCVYLDVDDLDQRARHLLGSASDDERPSPKLLAYLRLLPPGQVYAEAALGRIVVAPVARGGGVGKQLVEEGLRGVARYCPGAALRINAQQHLQAFYREFGFATVGEPELEDGIWHVQMLLDH